MTNSDDSFVAHSYVYNDPTRFESDLFISSYQNWVNTSILNLLPALLLKFFSIDPKVLFMPVTIFQNVFLYFSVGLLAKKFFNSKLSFWLSGLFFYIFTPQFFNLAWLAELDWMPYATWLALPFIVLSFSLLIDKRFKLAIAFGLISQLIHPSFGFLWIVFLLSYQVLYFYRDRSSSIAKVYYFSPLPLLALSFFSAFRVEQTQLPDDYKSQLIAGNGHFNFVLPWDSMAPHLTVRIWVFTLLFGINAFLVSRLYNNAFVKPLFLLALYSIFLILIDVIAKWLQLDTLMRIFGVRISIAFFVITVAIFIGYSSKLLLGNNIFLFLQGLFNFLYPVPPVLISSMLTPAIDFNIRKLSKVYYIFLIIFFIVFSTSIVTMLSFYHLQRWNVQSFFVYSLISGTYLDTRFILLNNFIWTPLYINQSYSVLLGTLIFFIVLVKTISISRRRIFFPQLKSISFSFLLQIILIATLIIISGIGARNDLLASGYRKNFDEATAYRDAQIWIKNNTPNTAKFIAFQSGGFRTLTMRPTIQVGLYTNAYVYTKEINKYNLEYEKFLNDFTSLDESLKSEASFLSDYAAYRGATHLFIPNSAIENYPYEIIYKNDYYSVLNFPS